MLILKNGLYLTPEGVFKKGAIFVKGDRIDCILPDLDEPTEKDMEVKDSTQVIDLQGRRVIPGLIDVHTHGALGYDVMTATPEQICDIAFYLARKGTTSFLPTTITADIEDIKYALKRIRRGADMCPTGASIMGVHIEGPFINKKRKGAHDPSKIRKLQIQDFIGFKDIIGDIHIHVTMAPELEGAMDFIRYVCSQGATVGIGHSDGDHKTINKAIEEGCHIFTHVFNGMRGLHHREPGVAGTALVSDVPVEVICDGIHLHPAVVKLIYRVKGPDGIVLITDAMHATGLGDGEYQFGGSKISVVNGEARQEDGTLAGSTLSMFKALKNIMDFVGIPLETAVKMATINPARVLGIDDVTGSIENGKRADLVVLNHRMEIDMVFCRGRKIV